MKHIDYLASIWSLRAKAVVDVGTGDGVYAQELYQEGAFVTAIEIDAVKVSKARDKLPPSVDVKLGKAEQLPVETRSQDLVCFFFSLHHVPVEVQDLAFCEVRRVLKSGGRLHVVEPFPYGTMFEVVRLVEDETSVRTNSHKILGRLDGRAGFKLVSKQEYVLTREYPTFGLLTQKIVRSNPDRSARFEGVAKEMEETYERVVEEENGVRVLHQPCAAYHFAVESSK